MSAIRITTNPPLSHHRVRDITYSEPQVFAAQSVSLTCSWGLQPAMATVRYAGTGAPVTVGSRVRIELLGDEHHGYAHTYEGICKSDLPVSGTGGQVRDLQFEDYRVELAELADVFGCFNKVDKLRIGDQTVKRYYSILPADFVSNLKTRLVGGNPMTAWDVINYLFGSLGTGWRPFYLDPTSGSKIPGGHPAFSDPVYDIDCMGGKKVGVAIQEVCDQLGLTFTIMQGPGSTPFDLVFCRKGDGPAPQAPADSDDRRDGRALSSAPSRVTVIGDRNTYQIHNVELKPDWARGYEQFFDLLLWQNYVFENLSTTAVVNGIPANTRFNAIEGDLENVVGRQLANARALEITVGEFSRHTSNNPLYTDWRKFAGKPRMLMPVALYIQHILFRAFRPKSGFAFRPNETVELVPRMLADVSHDPVTGLMSFHTDRDADGPGYAIARGYMVGADGFKTIRPDRFRLQDWTDLQNIWQHVPFQIDESGDGEQFILFDEPVIRSRDLFVGGTGETQEQEFNGYMALNASPTFEVPPVRAALTFQAERFAMAFERSPNGSVVIPWWNSYARNETVTIPNLNREAVRGANDWVDVPYSDGQSASQKAQQIASAVLSRQWAYRQGGYRRIFRQNQDGSWPAGTQLSGQIDRVTVSVGPDGFYEQVDFTAERTWSGPQPDRDFDRAQRDRSLFPGQKQLIEQANQARLLAAGFRASPRTVQTMIQALHGVQGEPFLVSATGEVEFGTPIWKEPNTTSGGRKFGTIGYATAGEATRNVFVGSTLVHNSAPGLMMVSTREPVQVIRVKGPVSVNQAVGKPASEADADYLVANGTPQVGIALEAISGDAVKRIQCRVGAAAGNGGDFPFRGGWNPNTQYYAGDVVVHRYRDDAADSADQGFGELRNGDFKRAGTYRAKVDNIGVEPTELPADQQVTWETVARGSWNVLVVGDLDTEGDPSNKGGVVLSKWDVLGHTIRAREKLECDQSTGTVMRCIYLCSETFV